MRSPDRGQPPAAVEPVIANTLAAWNRADAHAIAARYGARGDFLSPDGIHATGRREIETFHEGAFSRGYAGSRAAAAVSHVRDLTGSVALVDGAWTIEPTRASKVREAEAGLFFAVLHWQGGRWWIAALREQSSARTLREYRPGDRASDSMQPKHRLPDAVHQMWYKYPKLCRDDAEAFLMSVLATGHIESPEREPSVLQPEPTDAGFWLRMRRTEYQQR